MEEGKEEGGGKDKLINICPINESNKYPRSFWKSFNVWWKEHICIYWQEYCSICSLGLPFKESKEERNAPPPNQSQGTSIKY